MAHIEPFAAYRYNSEKAGHLDKVLTQPYDKISESLRKQYYQKSPYNLARIILGYDKDDDYKDQNKYERAASYLREWIQREVLIKDEKPSLYYYTQAYQLESGERKTRHGFIGRGKLDQSQVHAHEHTLAAPKKDRLNLLRATQANFGQIFMLYDDPEDRVNKLLSPFVQEKQPDVMAHDEDSNEHQLWKISDDNIIHQIQAVMQDKALFIADGHHRYETAVNFRQEMLKTKQHIPAMDYRMMTFVNMADPGLVILPTHRLVKDLKGFDEDRFLEVLTQHFDVFKVTGAEKMLARMKDHSESASVFGVYTLGGYYVFRLKNNQDMDTFFSEETSSAYRCLDVSILHTLVLDKLLGITAQDCEQENHLAYVRSYKEAIQRVNLRECQLAFFLNPTKISEVKVVAAQGERMPQKSTDFYPKLLSGLTIYAF